MLSIVRRYSVKVRDRLSMLTVDDRRRCAENSTPAGSWTSYCDNSLRFRSEALVKVLGADR